MSTRIQEQDPNHPNDHEVYEQIRRFNSVASCLPDGADIDSIDDPALLLALAGAMSDLGQLVRRRGEAAKRRMQ